MKPFVLSACLILTVPSFAQEMPRTTPLPSTVGKIADSDELVHPLGKGDTVPDGELLTADGKTVRLMDLLKKKNAVVIFYRGSWCPYCNEHLYKLQSIESDLYRLGYQILAITPDNVVQLKQMADRNQLTYTLLSDRSMKLTQDFGLAYRVGPDMMMALRKYGHDLDSATGNNLHLLPVPAAYVVNHQGKISYVYYNANFQKRANPEELLRAAKRALSSSN
jgi:peroxiredoxin